MSLLDCARVAAQVETGATVELTGEDGRLVPAGPAPELILP